MEYIGLDNFSLKNLLGLIVYLLEKMHYQGLESGSVQKKPELGPFSICQEDGRGLPFHYGH